MFKNIIRALRLPFITASVFPFAFGSLVIKQDLNTLTKNLKITQGYAHEEEIMRIRA
jgi:hypothetical protein